MKDYYIVALSDILKKLGENTEKINSILKKFSCQKEQDLENFLYDKAIRYEKENIGKTFLILDKNKLNENIIEILGFYTIGHTSIDISEMSAGKRRKVLGNIPGRDNLTTVPAFLIGQLGRNDSCTKKELDGETLLREVYTTINKVVDLIGGNLIILECREHMFSKFYEKQGFKKLSNDLDENKLYTLYKKLK